MLHHMILCKKNGISYLQFNILKEYEDRFFHGFFLRHGGVSQGEYSSLNFRVSGKDSKEHVLKNLEKVASVIPVSVDDICRVTQAHTDRIMILNQNNKKEYAFQKFCKEEADGYIIPEENIGSMIITADCNPIIIYDPIQNIVANVHSGWKGTIQQIGKKAAMLLHEKFSSHYEDLIVAVGPAIQSCCFTTKEESFVEKFTTLESAEEKFVVKKGEEYHIDLTYLIKKDMLTLGVKAENILLSGICTKCHHDDFFSYRYQTQHQKSDYGLMASIAYVKNK